MIRTQVLLDRQTHEALRRAATSRGKGISALVRELLRSALGVGRKRRAPYGFTFIGMVSGDRIDVAERHDDYLNEGPRW